jgi:hypothetical protein
MAAMAHCQAGRVGEISVILPRRSEYLQPHQNALLTASFERQSKKSETFKSKNQSPRTLPPHLITASLPQGARAKARSSPPAAFNSKISLRDLIADQQKCKGCGEHVCKGCGEHAHLTALPI